MAQAHILVVDDEPDIRHLMREILEDEGYRVEIAENGETARLAFTARTPDLVLLDIWMPDIDGISLLREWSADGQPACPVVMISGHGTLETAVEATRLGAHDFIQKPLSLAKLLATVKQALSATPQAPRKSVHKTTVMPAEPMGSSPQMQLLRQKAEQAAQHRTPVLILGEPGVGRTNLAHYIHQLQHPGMALLTLDPCQAGSENARGYLLGSTSGEQPAPGLLERARGSNLFIQELQNLGQEGQALLNSVLESGHFAAADSEQSQPLECRLMVSLTGDPKRLVAEGQLHEALFFRLNVLALRVPPLRDRPEDVPELVRYYADWFPNNESLPYRAFSISALNRLRNHNWPGNVLELRNLVQRLLILGREGEVSAQEVDEALQQGYAAPEPGSDIAPGSFDLPLREAREQFEHDYLVYQLQKAGGSVGKLAESAEMERTHLYRKLRSLGIDPKSVTGKGAKN